MTYASRDDRLNHVVERETKVRDEGTPDDEDPE
jgi:hypothetical protein